MYTDRVNEEIDGSLVSLLQKDEIVRKVTQVFCLERLASGDTITARTLLANMVAVSKSPLHLALFFLLKRLSDSLIFFWSCIEEHALKVAPKNPLTL